jgi:hypothetical protein
MSNLGGSFIRQVASLFGASRKTSQPDRQPENKTGSEQVKNPAAVRVERAPRFQVHLPLWYRPHGGLEWIESKTENISRTGVLLQVELPLKPKTLIEMNLTLPVEVTGKIELNVVCWARVVRATESGGSHLIAVKMMQGRLSRS